MLSKVWDEIYNPFPNLSGTTVEGWMNNFTPHFMIDVISYPCCDLS